MKTAPAEIPVDVLVEARRWLGCPAEIEFAVNLALDTDTKAEFNLLLIRPMGIQQHHMDVEISQADINSAVCCSTQALGNGSLDNIADIVYVNPDTFDPPWRGNPNSRFYRLCSGIRSQRSLGIFAHPASSAAGN